MTCGNSNTISLDLNKLCTQQFRRTEPRAHFHFAFQANNTAYSSFKINNGTQLLKTKNSSTSMFVSDRPLTGSIIYFEIEFEGTEKSGTSIGLADSNIGHSFGFLEGVASIFYNNTTGKHLLINPNNVTVLPNAEITIEEGVLGVVVDKIADEIRYYFNGKIIAYGDVRPSEFKQFYVVIGVYDVGQELQICERYPYSSLKNKI